jgi:hypothetical protein
MKERLTVGFLILSSAALGQTPPVPERLIYELTNSILDELRPQALTWYKRGPDGKYQWQRPMSTDTPAVRLLLQDRLDGNWCTGLMCVAGPDSARYEAQLLRFFTAANLQYMRQQLPATARFVFQQAKIKHPWVHVVPVDTISALRKRLGWKAHMSLGDSVLQRFGDRNPHHISHMVFTKDRRRALVTVGDAYNGYNVCTYRKTGSVWRLEEYALTVQY